MCEFVSWINLNGTNYFLTDKDLRGKKFNEYKKYNSRWVDDISGHGAIRFFYPELENKGEDKQCTDFSSPSNFPSDITVAIKEMRMTRIGISKELLNLSAKCTNYIKHSRKRLDDCLKMKDAAWLKYMAIKQEAWDKYWVAHITAFVTYDVIERDALARYQNIKLQIEEKYYNVELKKFWGLFKDPKNRTKAWR